MEYEKCYVFRPIDSRPAKRRKTEQQGLQASWSLRKMAYQQAWKSQQDRIDLKLDTINAATASSIADFLDDATRASSTDRMPTALILAGPDSALRTSIASQVGGYASTQIRRLYVSISSSSGTNLKALLKTIIQKATSRTAEDNDDELDEETGPWKGRKMLNHDLQALHDFAQDRRMEQVVIAIEDTEAFDGDLLSELIEMLGYWHGRIQFACLFNVATSLAFLQQRLSTSAVKCLDGRLFDAALSVDEIELVFEAITSHNPPIWLGANPVSLILERQTDYIQSIDSMVQAVHYSYMSCYYANALSLFLDPDLKLAEVPNDHFEALRNLESFQEHTRQLLDVNEAQTAGDILDSDQALFSLTKEAVAKGRQAMAAMMVAIELVRQIQSALPNTNVTTKPSLYIQAMSGKLASSPTIRSLLLALRKAPSNLLLAVLKSIFRGNMPSDFKKQISATTTELEQLVGAQDSEQPLRSEEDMRNSTLRTTVIAQKIEISKQKSTLSKQDLAYTAILRSFSDLLGTYLADQLADPKRLVMHEIFIYDLRSPYREVFTPRPRQAIERALALPHDYLDCDCCAPSQENPDEAALAAMQPATAILYQLYLESGSLINASDLWQAFQAVVSDNEEDEQLTMALFQRALSEMRYLGLVKSTRKRVDHIAKVAWRGL